MKTKYILLVVLISLFSFQAIEAKRSGFVVMKSFFKKPQNVQTATYTEDTENNSAALTLGGRRKFTSASIIVDFNDLLDQIEKGAEFITATTGTTDTAGTVKLNILAAKFKTGGGYEYTTFQDDESTVKDVKVKVLKVSKSGKVKLSVKATFDNVRCATLDENSEESSVERIDDITIFGKIKYDPAG